jgi:hypothetical protein
MTSQIRAHIVVLASRATAPRADKLAQALARRGLGAEILSPKGDDGEVETLAPRLAEARAAVVFVDTTVLPAEGPGRMRLIEALASVGERLTLVAVDSVSVGALGLLRADALPARGSLAGLSEAEQAWLFGQLVHELAAEVDEAYTPEPASHFDEYKLLVESTERQVDRRKGATPTFLAVNAAISGFITFIAKDLSLGRARLALAVTPLFVVGMLACRLWGRTLRQYESLIDWRYRQLRRIERRGLPGGYRMFSREWEALYAPRARAAFGFSSLEVAVANVFIAIYGVGLVTVLGYAAFEAFGR